MTIAGRPEIGYPQSSRPRRRSGHVSVPAVVWLALSLAMTACDLSSVRSVVQTPTPPSVGPTVDSQTTATATVVAAPTDEVAPGVVLTLWTTEDLAPGGENAGGALLADQIAAFEAANTRIAVEFELKKPYGRAGVLDYLLATQAAAPANMPDLVVLDFTELPAAARAGILRPLDEDLADVISDLFPFAQDAGRVDGQFMGVPFEVDVEHLAFNRAVVSRPPATWQELINGRYGYIFPAGGRQGLVNDAFLIQYLALGGQLVDEAGEPALDEGALVKVLQLYRDGAQAGVVPPEIRGYRNLDDGWTVFKAGKVQLTNVSSWRFLNDRANLTGVDAAAVPTANGTEITIARGWAYAVVAQEPGRYRAAVQVLGWLVSPENLRRWSQASDHLPTRRSAINGTGDSYMAFLVRQLEIAQPAPPASVYARIGEPLQRAVEDVLAGDLTPKEAAAQILSVLQ